MFSLQLIYDLNTLFYHTSEVMWIQVHLLHYDHIFYRLLDPVLYPMNIIDLYYLLKLIPIGYYELRYSMYSLYILTIYMNHRDSKAFTNICTIPSSSIIMYISSISYLIIQNNMNIFEKNLKTWKWMRNLAWTVLN